MAFWVRPDAATPVALASRDEVQYWAAADWAATPTVCVTGAGPVADTVADAVAAVVIPRVVSAATETAVIAKRAYGRVRIAI